MRGIFMPKQNTDTKEKLFLNLAKGLICGVIAVFLGMLLFSFIAAKFELPPSVMPVLLIPILIFGGFIAGFSASAFIRKNGMFNGMIVGAMLAAIELAAVLAATGQAPAGNAITKAVILIVSAMAGGILGVNKKSRKKR